MQLASKPRAAVELLLCFPKGPRNRRAARQDGALQPGPALVLVVAPSPSAWCECSDGGPSTGGGHAHSPGTPGLPCTSSSPLWLGVSRKANAQTSLCVGDSADLHHDHPPWSTTALLPWSLLPHCSPKTQPRAGEAQRGVAEQGPCHRMLMCPRWVAIGQSPCTP